jgi:hypothetical protein
MTDHETREQAISALVEELAARSPWDDSPSGRYEFCHYCANTRVTGTEGQHADDCLWQRAALLTADAALPSSLGQAPQTWESAAKRLGEELAASGPHDYYAMTPEQWLEWALVTIRRGPSPRSPRRTRRDTRPARVCAA